MSTYRLDRLFSPRSVALVGASPRQHSVGRTILENLKAAGFRRSAPPRQSASCRNRRRRCGQVGFGFARNRPCDRRFASRDCTRRHRGGRRTRMCVSHHRDRGSRAGAGLARRQNTAGGAPARYAPAWAELPGRPGNGSQAECKLRRTHAASGRPCADFAVRRDCRGTGRVGRAAHPGIFRGRISRKSDRRRFRRSARLLRDRPRDPIDPALHRVRSGRLEIHVRGPRRGPDKTGHRHQVRPARAGSIRRAHPHRRARRLRRRL